MPDQHDTALPLPWVRPGDFVETADPADRAPDPIARDRADLDPADLDPADWAAFRATAHQALDGILDHLATLRDQPVWQPTPEGVRTALRTGLPDQGEGIAAVLDQFERLIQPYATGNTHPRFMGWVHGGGNVAGMLGEMLAAGLNANLGGRDHAPILVERQVIALDARPCSACRRRPAGLLVTGTSIANLIGVLIARAAAAGPAVRRDGVGGLRLAAYTSAAAHGCIPRAMDMAGLGTDALRLIPTDVLGRIDVAELEAAIAARPRRRGAAVPAGRHRGHGRYRRHRRPRRPRRPRRGGGDVVPRGRRVRRARRPSPPTCARCWRDRGGRQPGLRLPQMGPGALRRRLHPGARPKPGRAGLRRRPPPTCDGKSAASPAAHPGPATSAPTSRAGSAR